MTGAQSNSSDRVYAIVPSSHGTGFNIVLNGSTNKPAICVKACETMQEADAELARLILAALGDSV